MKQDSIIALLEKLPNGLTKTKVGERIEGRAITKVEWGSGTISVALWSQMHGDESTATRALFDLFRYLGQESTEVKVLSEKLHLHIIPMLNPDGAEKNTRRNAAGIDMNRDALALSSPESKILKELIQGVQADYGFNLHDQSRYYRIGDTPKPATVTFLAPAFDEKKSLNSNRNQVMQMILQMKEMLENFIPGQVGRYDDTFNYRAFGDNIQKWGTAVVLFEAGEMPGDPEREGVRKLTFLSLVHALYMIADGPPGEPAPEYFAIPENNANMVDLLVRNVHCQGIEMDLGINYLEGRATIFDLGDLSNYCGYKEVSVEGALFKGALADLRLEKTIDLRMLVTADGSPLVVSD
jgi:hypothetical protein